MKTFNLQLYQRLLAWRRDDITVEVETLKDAIQKCIDEDYTLIDSDIAYSTIEEVDKNRLKNPEDPTFMICDDSLTILYSR